LKLNEVISENSIFSDSFLRTNRISAPAVAVTPTKCSLFKFYGGYNWGYMSTRNQVHPRP